jgi:hypothetical protein
MSAFSRRTRLADICRERLNAGSTVKPLINPARVFPAAIYRDRLFGPPGRMRQPWGSLAILVRSDAATAVSGANARVDYGGDVGALNFGGGAEHDTRSGLGLGRQPLQHRGDKSRLLVGGHRSGQSCTMSRFASSRRMGISGGPPSIKPHRAGKKYLFRRSRKGGDLARSARLGLVPRPCQTSFGRARRHSAAEKPTRRKGSWTLVSPSSPPRSKRDARSSPCFAATFLRSLSKAIGWRSTAPLA